MSQTTVRSCFRRPVRACQASVLPWLLAAILGAAACQSACGQESAKDPRPRKLRVVVMGAHCDDPESGAGGLIISLTRAGHEVIVAYTVCFRDGRRCFGRPEAEVRRREAEAACKIMGATPKFFPYAAEKLVADEATVKAVAAWLDGVKPDIVVTHWPLDTHPNHHVTSSLVWQCYHHQGGWNLYFFEVETGLQSLGFRPDLYLDVGAVRAAKEQACFCHKSQDPIVFWRIHEQMHRDRGRECGVQYAEAYMLVEPKPNCPLLPVEFLSKQH
jgi:LmbE family N-acetylglucosaminyl deacetylase